MVRGKKRGWVIMNAFDGVDPQLRRVDTHQQLSALAGIGLTTHEFDLRSHNAESLAAEFGDPDFVWVRGGNVFTLRGALARSGADALIVDRLRTDSLVYAGFSAGGCVLAPSLQGLEKCDPTGDALELHGAATFDGLNILDRPFVPHLGTSNHPEREILTQVAATYTQNDKQYWALQDGQALVIDGNRVELI